MTTKSTRTTLALMLAGLLALAVGPAAAQDDDEGFQLELDPIILEPFFVDVDTRSAKFEEYRDVSQDMTVPLIHLYGQSADGDRWLDFRAENTVRDDARYTLLYSDSGSYSLKVDYNVIPHRFLNDATLPWSTRTAGNVFEIADPTQAFLQRELENASAIDFDFLNELVAPFIATANVIDPRLERKRSLVRFDITKTSGFGLGFQVKHERRDGSRPYAGTFGFGNVLEIVEPIDYETTDFELSGEWSGNRGGAQFGYRYSMFDNANLALIYDNPFRAVDSTSARAYVGPSADDINGPVRGQNSLAPDNTANLVWFNGRTRIGERGWMNGNLNYNVMSQDEPLLPYSTNSAIGLATGAPFDVTDLDSLPVRNADTQAKALNLSVKAGSKLGDKADVSVGYRLYDYDNDSPRVEFPGYVRMDAVFEDVGRITVPYDYRRQTVDASVGFDVHRATKLSFGYAYENWDRAFREIESADENTVSARVDHRASRRLRLNARYEYGRRTIGEYSTEAQELSFLHPEGINNQPGLRKFDEADRTFNRARVLATLTATDQVDCSFGVNYRKQDYDESEFGLLDDDQWELLGEINVHPTSNVALFAFGNYADREVFQRARQSGGTLSTNPQDDWEATLDEKTATIGAGLDASLTPRWKLRLEGNWIDADGDAVLFSPPGGTPDEATGFDNYDDSELLLLKANIDWVLNDLVSAGVGYWYENYETARFGVDGIASYAPGAVLLAGNDGDYEANVFTMRLRMSF